MHSKASGWNASIWKVCFITSYFLQSREVPPPPIISALYLDTHRMQHEADFLKCTLKRREEKKCYLQYIQECFDKCNFFLQKCLKGIGKRKGTNLTMRSKHVRKLYCCQCFLQLFLVLKNCRIGRQPLSKSFPFALCPYCATEAESKSETQC